MTNILQRDTTQQSIMTPEELAEFDEASNHPYECSCGICKKWWELMGDEDDE